MDKSYIHQVSNCAAPIVFIFQTRPSAPVWVSSDCVFNAKRRKRRGEKEQTDYVEKVFSTGGNSFRAQDQSPTDLFEISNRMAKDGFTDAAYMKSLRPDKDTCKKAGWGIFVSSQKNVQTLIKSLNPTWVAMGKFQRILDKAKTDPKLFFTHLRYEDKDVLQPMNKRNLHPFCFGDWHIAAMGRNVLDGVESKLISRLHAWKKQDPSIPLPKSMVDIELFGCYFAAKLKQATGSYHIRPLSHEQVMTLVRSTFTEVFPNEDPQKPTLSRDFIISDGDRLIITSYRKDDNARMFWKAMRERETDGKKELLLSLEQMEPDLTKPLNWERVPHNSLALFALQGARESQHVISKVEALFPKRLK